MSRTGFVKFILASCHPGFGQDSFFFFLPKFVAKAEVPVSSDYFTENEFCGGKVACWGSISSLLFVLDFLELSLSKFQFLFHPVKMNCCEGAS